MNESHSSTASRMPPRSPHYQRERGERQMTRLLAACADVPMSARELTAALNISLSNVNIYAKRLREAEPRRLYIAGRRENVKGCSSPLYQAGNLPDVICIHKRKPKLPDRVQTQRNRILATLATPMTAKAVAALIARSVPRTVKYISDLRAEKLVYVCGWEKPAGRGDLAPIYSLGCKQDAPKPRQTRKERYRAEMKDEDRRERILSLRRTRTWEAKAKSKPTTWLSALGHV